MNDDLERQALEIAIPLVRAGDTESAREDLWLRLYEALGWANAATIDIDVLITQARRAVEGDRLRAAGWSEADIEEWLRAWDVCNLLEASRPHEGETFDRDYWAGPLADVITAYRACDLIEHPYLQIIPFTVGRKQIEKMLVALGAPASCTVGLLSTPFPLLTGHGRPPEGFADEFYEGSQLPLSEALDIAKRSEDEAELFCLPGRLAYAQHHEIRSAYNSGRAIAHRP